MQFLLNHLYYYNENGKTIFYLSSLLTAKISFENIKWFQSYCNLNSVYELYRIAVFPQNWSSSQNFINNGNHGPDHNQICTIVFHSTYVCTDKTLSKNMKPLLRKRILKTVNELSCHPIYVHICGLL